MNFRERRNIGIPLEKRVCGATYFYHFPIELPYWIGNRVVMSVEDVIVVDGMSSDMNLSNSFGLNTPYVIIGIKAVIL